MEPLKIASSVMLIAGNSPLMVIADIKGETAYCKWMVNSKLREGSFPLAVLRLYNPDLDNRGPRIIWTG
jgi:hypothetical protein